ncbi:IS1096 element passenger TnpR family protein [Compostibacter hankyongensis]|uniref:Plasmid pRiA4b Orf3-like domain-containing protein n=1 Tax=Compostibacter hankyongensis TaxID=1007089 RepID=A0ABP8FWS1_9BACT
MPVLKFRVYWEEDDSVYRDIVIKPDQTFLQFHEAILKSYEFDSKHKAVFFRSNDRWQRGREILLENDDRPRQAKPLMMNDTKIAAAVRDPSQKFIYLYDFVKNWTFQLELIGVTKEESHKLEYPACIRKEGLAPSQYGTKGLVNDKLVEMEEKYDLGGEDVNQEGFGEEGEPSESGMEDDQDEYGGNE